MKYHNSIKNNTKNHKSNLKIRSNKLSQLKTKLNFSLWSNHADQSLETYEPNLNQINTNNTQDQSGSNGYVLQILEDSPLNFSCRPDDIFDLIRIEDEPTLNMMTDDYRFDEFNFE